MLSVLLVFLIPFGGGIPGGVLLAEKLGLYWPITAGLYFISDVILALMFEPALRMIKAKARSNQALARFVLAFKQALQLMTATHGGAGPVALILVAFGVDPMTGRVVAALAGHGFLAGWAIAIAGDMLYFALIMYSTLQLNAVLNNFWVTTGIMLAAMFILPPVGRKLSQAARKLFFPL